MNFIGPFIITNFGYASYNDITNEKKIFLYHFTVYTILLNQVYMRCSSEIEGRRVYRGRRFCRSRVCTRIYLHASRRCRALADLILQFVTPLIPHLAFTVIHQGADVLTARPGNCEKCEIHCIPEGNLSDRS